MAGFSFFRYLHFFKQMKTTDIARLRLINQQIESPHMDSPKKLVAYMGAIQAQDYNMCKWAIGVRIADITEKNVEAALNKGDILRTHVLRPTWHLVSSADIYWMLELSAPQINSAMRSRSKQLELSEQLLRKTNNLIVKQLEGGKHAERDELVSAFKKAKISTDDNRAAHLLMHAELEGLICSGKMSGNKQTYALLEERVKKKNTLSRDEALATLALRYFSSHGPATLADFTWWSGLNTKDARHALEHVKKKLHAEKLNDDTYYLPATLKLPAAVKPSVHLLPAFDEFLISYKNRSASILLEHHKHTISSNGIFWPTVVVNGQVAGLWKRSIKKDKVSIETDLFHTKPDDILLKKAIKMYGDFIGKSSI